MLLVDSNEPIELMETNNVATAGNDNANQTNNKCKKSKREKRTSPAQPHADSNNKEQNYLSP